MKKLFLFHSCSAAPTNDSDMSKANIKPDKAGATLEKNYRGGQRC